MIQYTGTDRVIHDSMRVRFSITRYTKQTTSLGVRTLSDINQRSSRPEPFLHPLRRTLCAYAPDFFNG